MSANAQSMLTYELLNATDIVTTLEKNEITNFLHDNLGDYTDSKDNILKAIEYALSKFPHQGGFLVLLKDGFKVLGAAVVNKTNMEGYIPENVLVYFAIHGELRGKGHGREMLKRVVSFSKGDIAIHVRPDNPNIKIFENVGFKYQYKELRLEK